MKSILTKAIGSLIIFSLVASNLILAFPQKAEAQAASCVAGYAMAALASLASVPQNVLGVPKSQMGDTTQNIVTSGSANALSFNNCILKPLGQAILIALIRNIGASIVDWVNSGFDGKPTFITDFEGTLLDAADQAVGQLIEGSELGWLCNDFSFQIRIALAYKYSKPFKREIACTLSQIGDNVNGFVENNGGAGWDNWLQVTTQPNNNVYGAYLIADSELAKRALSKVDDRKKRISIDGFDSITSCDEYETETEARERYVAESSALSNPQVQLSDTFDSSLETENSDLGATTFDTNLGGTMTANSGSYKPQCKPGKTFIGTPGATIAHKLDSVLGQGEIQQAVAQEIDQVIAATLNQIAQQALMGIGGLLGSSRGGSTSGSYLNRYRSQYYGETVATSTGAQSAIDSYRVISYDESAALLSGAGSADVQEINKLVESTTASASAQQQEQIQSTQDNSNTDQNTTNIALLKTAKQSSGSYPGGANDGIRTVSNYMKGAVTANTDANAWWQVDLEKSVKVDKVRVWKVADSRNNDENTLGTFRVLTSSNGTDFSAGEWIDGAVIAQPVSVDLNKDARYVKIEKKAKSYTRSSGSRNQTTTTYYHPLELAEVEVITTIRASTSTNTTTTSSSSTNTTTTTATEANISLQAPSGNIIVKSGGLSTVSATFAINASASTVVPRIELDFSLNGSPVRFDSLLVSPIIGQKVSGITTNTYVSSNASIAFEGTPAGGNNNTTLTLSGTAALAQKGATYKLKITIRDAKGTTGSVITTETVNFVVE
jgi:hypothetical protein